MLIWHLISTPGRSGFWFMCHPAISKASRTDWSSLSILSIKFLQFPLAGSSTGLAKVYFRRGPELRERPTQGPKARLGSNGRAGGHEDVSRRSESSFCCRLFRRGANGRNAGIL